jgi:ribosomal protein L30/L7E
MQGFNALYQMTLLSKFNPFVNKSASLPKLFNSYSRNNGINKKISENDNETFATGSGPNLILDKEQTALFRVKLRRGLIGLPDRFKEHTKALGLRRTHQKSYVPICPSTIGNILRIKELIELRIVKGKPVPGAKYWAKGFSVVGSYLK